MKLLVFGETGQVATEIRRRAPAGMTLTALGRCEADLSNPKACADIIRQTDAAAVINAAAYTAVDKAEEEEALATIVNGETPGAMARAAAERGLPFVHISTDYVFDGNGTLAFAADAPTAPLGAYGRSKRVGEEHILAAGGAQAILRTSWVFSARGGNFVKTMLRVGATRPELTVVDDQIGGPTPAAAIADAVLGMAVELVDRPEKAGVYHFSGAPDVSWADFARAIFSAAEMKTTVKGIPSSDWPTPAPRPANSRMDCTSLASAFGIERPDWHRAVEDVIQELAKEES